MALTAKQIFLNDLYGQDNVEVFEGQLGKIEHLIYSLNHKELMYVISTLFYPIGSHHYFKCFKVISTPQSFNKLNKDKLFKRNDIQLVRVSNYDFVKAKRHKYVAVIESNITDIMQSGLLSKDSLRDILFNIDEFNKF